jgi:hypothetical protein
MIAGKAFHYFAKQRRRRLVEVVGRCKATLVNRAR